LTDGSQGANASAAHADAISTPFGELRVSQSAQASWAATTKTPV
jgi:hypothetical protein